MNILIWIRYKLINYFQQQWMQKQKQKIPTISTINNQNDLSFDCELSLSKEQQSKRQSPNFDHVFKHIQISDDGNNHNGNNNKRGLIVRNGNVCNNYQNGNQSRYCKQQSKQNMRNFQSIPSTSAMQQINQMMQITKLKIAAKKQQQQLTALKSQNKKQQQTAQQYIKQINQLKKQLQKQKEKNIRQKQQQDREINKLNKLILEKKAMCEQLQQQNQQKREKIKKIQQQKQKYKTKSTKIQKTISEIQQSNKQLQHKLRIKQKQIQKTQQIQKEHQSHYQQLFQKKQKQIEKLKTQLNKKSNQNIQTVQRIEKAYQEKYQQMVNILEEKQKQIDKLVKQIEEKYKEIQEVNRVGDNKLGKIVQQTHMIQNYNAQLAHQLQQKNQQINQLTNEYKRYQQISAQNKQLKKQLIQKQQVLQLISQQSILQKQKYCKENKQLAKQIELKNQVIMRIAGVIGQGIGLLEDYLKSINTNHNNSQSKGQSLTGVTACGSGVYTASYKRLAGQIKNGTKTAVDQSMFKFLINVITEVMEVSKSVIKKKIMEVEGVKTKYHHQLHTFQKKLQTIIQENRYLKSLLQSKRISFNALPYNSNTNSQSLNPNQTKNVNPDTNSENYQSHHTHYRINSQQVNNNPSVFLPKINKTTIEEDIYQRQPNKLSRSYKTISNEQLQKIEKQQQALKASMRFVKSQRKASCYNSANYYTIGEKPQTQIVMNKKQEKPEKIQRSQKLQKHYINIAASNISNMERLQSSNRQKYLKQQIILNQGINIKKQVQKARKLYNKTTLKYNYDDPIYIYRERHKSLTNLHKQMKIPERKNYI